jgi:hypothetical protein
VLGILALCTLIHTEISVFLRNLLPPSSLLTLKMTVEDSSETSVPINRQHGVVQQKPVIGTSSFIIYVSIFYIRAESCKYVKLKFSGK